MNVDPMKHNVVNENDERMNGFLFLEWREKERVFFFLF